MPPNLNRYFDKKEINYKFTMFNIIKFSVKIHFCKFLKTLHHLNPEDRNRIFYGN